MRDNLTSPDSDHPSSKPGSIDGMSRPGDVDQLVFSFLSELNTFSDSLQSARDKPAEVSTGESVARKQPVPVAAQPAAPKTVPYRNIDVLLMDNKQFQGGKEKTQQKSLNTVHGLFESQSSAHSVRTRQRRTLMLRRSGVSLTLLGTLGLLLYFAAAWQSTRTEDTASQAHTGPTPSLARAGAPVPTPKGLSPAMPIEKVAAQYPAEARKLGLKGTVELDVEVDASGKVVRALPVSGPLLLRSAAAEALKKWRFKPAQREGKNLRSTIRVPFVFDR